MPFYLFLSLLSLLHLSQSFAQPATAIEELLKDKDITWLGETTYDYQLFPANGPNRPLPGNAFQVLKSYQYPQGIIFDEVQSPFFKWLSPEWLEAQDFSFFKDETLEQPLEDWKSFLLQKEEIETYDAETLEPRVEIIENRLDASRLLCLRLRQLLYFDKRKGRFEVVPLALAPIIRNEANQSELLYWIQLPDYFVRKRLPIQRKRFSWAVRSIMRDTLLEPQSFRMYKQGAQQDFSYLVRKQLRENPKELFQFITDEEPLRDLKEELLGAAGEQQALSRQVDALRLVQVWLWDKRKERFELHLEAVAPIHLIELNTGPPSSLPLYYQR